MPPLLLASVACLLGQFWAGLPVEGRWLGVLPVVALCLLAGRGTLAILLALSFGLGLVRAALLTPPALEPLDLVRRPATTEYRGIVVAYPEASAGGERLTVELEAAGDRPASGRVHVQTVRPENRRYGDLIAFQARLRPVGDAEPAAWQDYLQGQGFAAHAFTGGTQRLASGRGNPAGQVLAALRDRLSASLDRTLQPPVSELARGLTVGDCGTYAPDLVGALRRSGLSHIVAVSGYNVVLVAGSVWAATGALFGRRPAVWLAVPVIAGYAVLTGLEPPVTRAALMTGLAGLGWWLGRPVHLPTLLAVSAAGLGLHDPLILTSLSFLLSFAATAGLLFVLNQTPREEDFDAGGFTRLVNGLRQVILATVVATLAIAPIALGAFGTLSLVAPISNLLAAPLVPPATFGAAAVAVTGLVNDGLAGIFAIPVSGVLRAILWIAETTGNLPGATVDLPDWRPEWAWPVYGALALFVWWRETARPAAA